jgi:hypothetical protein
MLTESRRVIIERMVMLGGSAALAGAYAAGIGGAVQAAVAALFFLVCPGLALLAPARFALAVELALLVPVSLAVTALVSVALFFTGFWSGPLAVGVLIGGVVVGAVLTVRPRSARSTAAIVGP